MIQEKREQYRKLLKESLDKVVRVMSSRAERISLFGSCARGKPHTLFTDLDILIIMKTNKPFLERTKEIYSLLALPVDADILCYSPEEFERLKGKRFFRNLLKEEIILYEKRARGGGEEVVRTGR